MIPLLRGSGRHIVTEPLVQAERDVIYAIWDFEQYKREFAVSIANRYLEVLRLQDRVMNSRENYISAMTSARQSRRLADAGRLTEIEVDQAVQRELDSRAQWIGAVEGFKQQLDSLKTTLGLPPDAQIELDRADMEKLQVYKEYFVHSAPVRQSPTEDEGFPSADAVMEPQPPTQEDARPLELPEQFAIDLAFENRLDLRVAAGRVYDAQREVVIRADALGAELTLLGSANFGSGRSLGSAESDDAQIQFDKGRYTALLTLDLPLERTAERNAYRNSYLAMEESVRTVQQLEDSIKLSIRNELRSLMESREQVKIQALAVTVAEKRQKSTKMFLDAGRAAIRDLLEAQDSLLSAQNQLTAAIINYRIAELNIQRDMGVLQVDETGLWKEFTPEEMKDDNS
jgi:outer membrane protein TolC